MTYTVRFRDKHTAGIEDKDGDALGLLLMQTRKPDYVEINGDTVRTSEILSVTKNKVTQADIPAGNWEDVRALTSGNKCKGQFSINRAIMAEAGKLKQPRLLADKKWRADTKARLLKQTDKWCDQAKGICHCEQLADGIA